jgi:hypothetical protein
MPAEEPSTASIPEIPVDLDPSSACMDERCISAVELPGGTGIEGS